VFAHFDAWVTSIRSEAVTPDDVRAATRLVRRFDLALRTPDALNLAIADRCGATVLTFDAKMALAARALGINVLGA